MKLSIATLCTSLLALSLPRSKAATLEEIAESNNEELCNFWTTQGDDYTFGISCAIMELEGDSSSGVSESAIKTFMETNQPEGMEFDTDEFDAAIKQGLVYNKFVEQGEGIYTLTPYYETSGAALALAKMKELAENGSASEDSASAGGPIAGSAIAGGASGGSGSKSSKGMMRLRK